jgi:uncharacterized protein YcaQ
MSNVRLGRCNHFLITESYKKVSTLTAGWLAAFLALAWPDAKTIRAQNRNCL